MSRTFAPPPRATIILPDAPTRGPLVTPIDWAAGDRAIAQYFWTSTDKDADAWTCDEAEVRRVLNFGLKAQPVPHGTPNGHGFLTVHVENISLPDAEQMLRHRVQVQSPDGDGMGWLEWAPNVSKKSYRYVTAKGETVFELFAIPEADQWRSQTGRPGHYTFTEIDPAIGAELTRDLAEQASDAWNVYQNWLKRGVAPEQARLVLPTALKTRLYLTASYRNWFNWLIQRNDNHAQLEIHQVGAQVEDIMAQCCPITYLLWNEHGRRMI